MEDQQPKDESTFGSVSHPLQRIESCLDMCLYVNTSQTMMPMQKLELWSKTLLNIYRELYPLLKKYPDDLDKTNKKMAETDDANNNLIKTYANTKDNRLMMIELEKKLHELELLLREYAHKYKLIFPAQDKSKEEYFP